MASYPPAEVSGPHPVLLHVYDVTNAASPAINATVSGLNRLTKDVLGLGGVFHGGIEVHGREYSYGFVEQGSGVYPCSPKKNPMYTFRETVDLGTTSLGPAAVRALIADLSLRWSGESYALLTRNCVHFCEELCSGLGCTKGLPPWVNAAAAGADGAARAAAAAAAAGRELAKSASEWLRGVVASATASVGGAATGEKRWIDRERETAKKEKRE